MWFLLMALETKLVQKLSQSLLMTPQLQQAIKLLQLGRLEYIEAIQRELLENPVLEELKSDGSIADAPPREDMREAEQQAKATDAESLAKSDDSPLAIEDYLANYSDYKSGSSSRGNLDFDDRPSLEATLSSAETLYDHLASQLRMSELDTDLQTIALHILGNLDKDGYLCSTHEEICEECSCSQLELDRTLTIIKELDPIGVGARNLRECLLWQLEAMGLENCLAYQVVDKHLEKLERRKYELIAKEEGVDLDKVYDAIIVIRSLEPRPGHPYADDTAGYITPDIYVYKDSGEYVISLNEDGMPKLRVSPYYLDILKNESSGESRAYLNDRLKAASWLIKSIHQRQQTIYKVTESIVKFQRDFFDFGISRLKPLVLKDVADDIGMHESTVSRVTTNKYVHTPQGVFELKFFFSTGIKSGAGEVSSSAVKERIRELISAEKPEDPISDQAIVDILKSENVKIARRTVAKYRESMNILSSSKRKKLF